MPRVYAIDGIVPVVEPSAFVHPSAATSAASSSKRARTSRTAACCTAFPARTPSPGPRRPSGHGAILHGCVVRRGALIGMNCVINDNAEIGEDAVVAALAFVKAEARIPARSLAAGIPARVLRELSEEEIRWKRDNMALYQQLAVRSATTMREVEALTRVEPGRPRIEIPASVPLSELKRQHG